MQWKSFFFDRIEFFLSNNANPEVCDEKGYTAFYYAVRYEDYFYATKTFIDYYVKHKRGSLKLYFEIIEKGNRKSGRRLFQGKRF